MTYVERFCLNSLLFLTSLVTIFHALILAKVIPYTVAWGGKLHSDADMYRMEAASLLVNLFLGYVLLQYGQVMRPRFSRKLLRVLLGVFLLLFVLNTVGNLFAVTRFEQALAAVTALFALLLAGLLYSSRKPKS